MSRRRSIGFDRRIELPWLDAAAGVVATSASPSEVRDYLWKVLDGEVSGEGPHSARGKTVTVLSHVWGTVPVHVAGLRQSALALLETCQPEERLALHWAMMVATYPVFTDVATAAGRLLALQGAFTLAHAKQRLIAAWGKRSTVERATQRIIRSMVQWGVLVETSKVGTYAGSPKVRTIGVPPSEVLLEALLIDAEEDALPLQTVARHPATFPFSLTVDGGHLRRSSRFTIHRQGIDSDVVALTDSSHLTLRRE